MCLEYKFYILFKVNILVNMVFNIDWEVLFMFNVLWRKIKILIKLVGII